MLCSPRPRRRRRGRRQRGPPLHARGGGDVPGDDDGRREGDHPRAEWHETWHYSPDETIGKSPTILNGEGSDSTRAARSCATSRRPARPSAAVPTRRRTAGARAAAPPHRAPPPPPPPLPAPTPFPPPPQEAELRHAHPPTPSSASPPTSATTAERTRRSTSSKDGPSSTRTALTDPLRPRQGESVMRTTEAKAASAGRAAAALSVPLPSWRRRRRSTPTRRRRAAAPPSNLVEARPRERRRSPPGDAARRSRRRRLSSRRSSAASRRSSSASPSPPSRSRPCSRPSRGRARSPPASRRAVGRRLAAAAASEWVEVADAELDAPVGAAVRRAPPYAPLMPSAPRARRRDLANGTLPRLHLLRIHTLPHKHIPGHLLSHDLVYSLCAK